MLSRPELEEVVARSDKQRFSFDAAGTRIRANQGHSVVVDVQLATREPPPVLYHGTGHRAVSAITRDGLRKMRRHHVHLSPDVETARRVGTRHGRSIVFAVDAAAMRAAGYAFSRSENGVWLARPASCARSATDRPARFTGRLLMSGATEPMVDIGHSDLWRTR